MAYTVKHYGGHGVRLRFTHGGPSRRFTNIKSLVKEARKHTPQTHHTQQTDIETSLGPELENYRQRVEKVFKRKWTLLRNIKRIIYVFTDGCWQSNSSVTAHIKQLGDTLDECRQSSNQFGIQFIQFGNNTPAQKLLECRLGLSRYGLASQQLPRLC